MYTSAHSVVDADHSQHQNHRRAGLRVVETDHLFKLLLPRITDALFVLLLVHLSSLGLEFILALRVW